MRNLAGVDDCDRYIEEELFVAGIEPMYLEDKSGNEVPYGLVGRLGGFTFRRAWYYWVVKGEVPVDVARKMYAVEPWGRRDVRVAGHCGCPPPEDPWLTRIDAEGKELAVPSEANLESLRKYREGEMSEYMAKLMKDSLKTMRYTESTEELERLTVRAYIDTYHIDTQAGLKVFVDAVTEIDKVL